MKNKTFKLSTLSAALLMATGANAAIYKVVEVTPSDVKTTNQAIVVQPSDESLNSSNPLGCFGESCTDTTYAVAGNTFSGNPGIPYEQEVPFGYDNSWSYLDEDDLENYCDYNYGYEDQLCENVADELWYGNVDADAELGGLRRERDAFYDANYVTNSLGFVESSTVTAPLDSEYKPGQDTTEGTLVDNTNNVYITNLDDETPIGITSSGYYDVDGHYALAYRQRGFYGDVSLLPKQDAEQDIVKQMGRTYAYDTFEYAGNKYVVGAAAVAPVNFGEAYDYDSDEYNVEANISNCENVTDPAAMFDCQHVGFAQKAYVWNITDGASGVAAAQWHDGDTATDDEETAQSSVRAAVVPETGTYAGLPILVGYDSDYDDDDFRMQAAVFYPKDGFNGVTEEAWESSFVSNAELEDDNDLIYSHSVVKDINKNLIAIGESKRRTYYPENGSGNTEGFYIDNIESGSPSATYLAGGLFLDGTTAIPNAINNFNEMVGTVSVENTEEVDGKARRIRGFIYALDAEGTNAERRDIIGTSATLLDDLTLSEGDSASSEANQYRILEANDINDAGVIAAKAIKCEGGYDDLSRNALCGNGSQDEETVAVKLIPINGATAADRVSRDEDDGETVDRDGGGSLGVFGLFALALVSLRRKFS